jgi:hypothetical protein
MKSILFGSLCTFLLSSCAPSTPPVTPQLINVYSSAAAEPWLAGVYDCAAGTAAVPNRVADPEAAELVLRVGEPEVLVTPAFQIDSEEILVVARPESTVGELTLQGARALFAGQGDASVQVWVYAAGDDVQRIFEQAVMSGRAVAPSARLAANPQHMSEALQAEANAVGILPRRWLTGGERELLSVGTAPVLVITPAGPEGPIAPIIACLQG